MCHAEIPDVKEYRLDWPMVFNIPFKSKNKYQVHIHKDKSSGRLLLVMKGAPERIIARCDTIMVNGSEEPMV